MDQRPYPESESAQTEDRDKMRMMNPSMPGMLEFPGGVNYYNAMAGLDRHGFPPQRKEHQPALHPCLVNSNREAPNFQEPLHWY